MNITNKTNRPISVPLPGGKKLFLGPGKTGQIVPKSATHPPLVKLVEAGDLETDEGGHGKASATTDSSKRKAGGQGSGQSTNIRRTGDR
ncbi:MAG: hypothetical protein GY716_09165 [bacterium]|nr:hypothetical protein [bacterium]